MKYAFEALRDCGDKTVLYTKDYEELLLILDKMKKEDNFILFKGSHGTVSYTHLDVYKRQGMYISYRDGLSGFGT